MPVARLADDPNAQTITWVREKVEASGVVVFGVTVAVQPSCYTTTTVTDTYTGHHTAINASSAPVYQLTYQTGAGGQASNGAQTKVKTQVLPPLNDMTRIDSWASIVE